MSDDEVRDCWDANAEVWARQVRRGYDRYRLHYNNPAFFALVGDLEGLDVLDAGCGEGYNTRLFARGGAQVTGVDISSEMIALARAEEAGETLGIRYEVASVSNLSMFGDGSFHAIVSTMALMDCADYEGALGEFARVLRPGGMLAFSILHPCFMKAFRGWERDADGRVVGVRLGDYFGPSVEREQWTFSAAPDAQDVEPFCVVYFLRTLAEVLNPLAARFRLEAVVEPQASEAACEAECRLAKLRLIPQTLMIRARKPA